MREYLGQIGHFSVIIAFVTAIASALSYFFSMKYENELQNDWRVFARRLFYVHSIAIIIVVLSLFIIIFNHYFEYHYAWDNTSLSLPLGYAISCFWQDQEGSFLLWMFWNVVVGNILIKTAKEWESSVIFIFAAIQLFLSSMILGVVIYGEFKIGSSPFLLLKEARPDFPVFSSQPNYIPTDGLGLNPLLQNYWMVIHPPTLFLGFALTQVPFAFAMGGLIKGQYRNWIKPSLAWSLVAAVILGTGIIMGAIWAYETLNFGGYWNWDPVENAVYVPWLVLVASTHTLLLSRKSNSALKTSIILIIAQFILILYSTFLTRSGILGNTSVHSFTDLGLSGQLLIYLLTFIFLAIGICIWRWKKIPSDDKELTGYSREFWVLIGATALCLASFQIIIPTSYPVINKISELFGKNLDLATPANQVVFYSKWQMWFFIVITILTGIGQFFWWTKISPENVVKKFTNPLIITLALASILITFLKINHWEYIIVLTAGLFSIVSNATIILNVFKGNYKLTGGAFTHIGLAFMLLGILFSAGYSKVVSQNYMGYKVFDDEKDNNENIVLWMNKTHQMNDLKLAYRGQYVEVRGIPGFVKKELIKPLNGINALAKADYVKDGKTYFKKNDSLKYEAENTYYEVEYTDANNNKFTLFPRFQENERMGKVFSPDIKKRWDKDIYTHITFPAIKDEEKQWTPTEEFTVAMKDTFFINDYVAILDKVESIREVDGVKLATEDAAIEADVRVLDKEEVVMIHPKFIIKDKLVGRVTETNNQLGIKMQLKNIDPKTGLFTFGVNRSQREYVVMKAIEKPHINLLWFGTLLIIIGFTISAIRRFKTINEVI
jgi:cytochrome c-type biogenesis protein CcmF